MDDFLAEVDISDFESGDFSLEKEPEKHPFPWLIEPDTKPLQKYIGRLVITVGNRYLGPDREIEKGHLVVVIPNHLYPYDSHLPYCVYPAGRAPDAPYFVPIPIAEKDVEILNPL